MSTIKATVDGQEYSPVESISTGGKTVDLEAELDLEDKEVTITENGDTEITPTTGKDGIGSVLVHTEVEESGDVGYYETSYSFAYYTEIMRFPANGIPLMRGCRNLKEVYAPNFTGALSESGIFRGCSALEVAEIPNATSLAAYTFDGTKIENAIFPLVEQIAGNTFANNLNLKTVQLGSVGHPFNKANLSPFSNDTQENLTITIYVADGTTLPLSGAPWGATNATIIYRSATTGEVIDNG